MSDGLSLTERDRAVLAFAAEHRLVLARQVERLLRADAAEVGQRLDALTDAEYLRSNHVFNDRHCQIRARGLTAIGSRLPPPRLKLGAYKHDIGLAWLWLAAREGAFGPLRELHSERQLRSHDGAVERPIEPSGVRLGGRDRYGNERLHYPDLLLIDPRGRRLALELELSSKGRDRRELILGGYGADARIDRVLYLVEANAGGRAIQRALGATVREMRLADRIHVQLIKPLRLTGDVAREAPRLRAASRRLQRAEAAR